MDESKSPEGASKPVRNEPARTVDEPAGSVTRWIGDLKAGDGQALQALWDRYHATLVERARAKLCALRSSTAVDDEEIRRQLGCSLRTVTLKLELIRKKWRKGKDPS